MTVVAAIEPDGGRDAVTGLATREAAAARLTEWLVAGTPVQGLMIGLQRLDTVNMAYGTATGDAALAEVAARIRHFAADELDGPWVAARAGGGQFIVLSAEPCSRERWQVVAGQLLDVVARPIAVAGETLRLSPRGALLRGLEGESADSILDRLGHALGTQRAGSGARLGWADGEAIRAGRRAARLEADLLKAIDANEIEIVFQPQFACADNRLVGAEALARWNHPALGRIGAGGLFAIADRIEHVAQLSQHIARLALEHASTWPMDLRLSLNVTPADLATERFAAQFLATLRAAGFPAWRLTVEVTEQVLLADVSQAADALRALTAEGVRIALDDFGAGFCNFRYLKLLPLRTLKLDRAMVEDAATDMRDLSVLRAIVAMARALDLQVVAEGIESEAQRILVSAEGCSSYQGFIASPPVSAEAFLSLARG